MGIRHARDFARTRPSRFSACNIEIARSGLGLRGYTSHALTGEDSSCAVRPEPCNMYGLHHNIRGKQNSVYLHRPHEFFSLNTVR